MLPNDTSDESIFALALEKRSPAERAAFVEGACVGNPALLERVNGLLRSHEEAGSFLQPPLAPATETFGFDRISEGAGSRIGPYKLLQAIGEGGMGAVFMAEQEMPVRRKVALKVIKPGMDSAQVVARFEAERQALALMDHQNIAKVFDAGTTEQGRPFFVMELVKGVPITEYCDSNQLSPRERLELFVPVCRAIQHAHQKGIIHRDIKPSNVLVSLYDGVPVPKVIDFGVAKAIDQRLTQRTMFTQHGAILGTLEYMSPEQAENSALDIDTRSDVYSLGVLLYELLTGGTPLERATIREAGYAEILRRIKEEDPPRPSTRLSASRETLASISAQRKTDPSKLASLIRGELDWIVMKALEKNRSRRYETAVGLARDIERYLQDETVEACPPSTGYRLRKFASKHRTAVVTASSFAGLLMLAVIVSAWQAIRARQAEERAIHESVRVRRAEEQARAERDKAVSAERTAVDSQRETEAKRQEADAAREKLRRSLYASDIQLAQSAWASGNIVRMLDLLEAQRPGVGQVDLRGFEWHYLRRLGAILHTEKIAPGHHVGGAVSADGMRYIGQIFTDDPAAPGSGRTRELKLIDVNTRRIARTLGPFPGESYRWPLVFSADGERFAHQAYVRDAAGKRGWHVRIWDYETGREVLALSGLTLDPMAKALDRSAELLALASDQPGNTGGCELKVREIKGGKELYTLCIPESGIRGFQALAFSPDRMHLAGILRSSGPRLAISSVEVRIWEARTGKEILKFAARQGSMGLAYSPDGQFLAVAGEGGAEHQIREAGTGREVLELTGVSDDDFLPMISFSPDGSRLAAVMHTGRLRIWDLTDHGVRAIRSPEFSAGGNNMALEQPVWGAGGRSVSAVSLDGILATWQVPSAAERVVVKGPLNALFVIPAADSTGSHFAATFEVFNDKLEVKAWDETGKILFTAVEDISGISVQDARLRLSRDGSRLAVLVWTVDRRSRSSTSGRRLRVWELATGRELFRRDDAGQMWDSVPALSPDGRLLALSAVATTGTKPKTGARETTLSLWDLATGQKRLDFELPEPSAPDAGSDLAFSPDGRCLAGTMGRELRVWDTSTGKSILSRRFARPCHGDPAYSPDGRLLAVGTGMIREASLIEIVHASSGESLRSLAGHRSSIQKLVFSPDGRRLASSVNFSALPAEIKLWDLAGGGEVLTVQAKHLGSNLNDSLAFSADGHRLAYIPGGHRRDAELQVWDATPMPD